MDYSQAKIILRPMLPDGNVVFQLADRNWLRSGGRSVENLAKAEF